jgi:Ca2+-binding RTX toxin-like protein
MAILVGDEGPDTLIGGNGNDTLYGGLGEDQLIGGGGNDHLEGEGGADRIYGGAGNDDLFGGGGADSLYGGGGNDILYSSSGTAYANGGPGNDTIVDWGNGSPMHKLLGGEGDDDISASNNSEVHGGGGNDTIRGYYNSVFAGDGDDDIDSPVVEGISGLIDGGDGYDTWHSKPGYWEAHLETKLRHVEEVSLEQDNTFVLTAYSFPDEVVEAGNTLKVFAATTPYSLIYVVRYQVDGSGESDGHFFLIGANGDDILTGGGAADTIQGNAGADILTGGGASDTIEGGAGEDTLNGNEGNDLLDGGSGLDTARYGGNYADYEIETVVGGVQVSGPDGVDFLNNINFLRFNDQLVEISDPGLLIIGTDGNDSLVGSAGADLIRGLAGNDTLNGSFGKDILEGGSGGDLYFVDSADDAVVEENNDPSALVIPGDGGGGGPGLIGSPGIVDTVRASINYSLEGLVFVENLILIGEASSGIGNVLNNRLTGNAGSDTLDGGGGNDTLNGGSGSDSMSGGAGADTLVWGSADRINGGDGTDTLRLGVGPLNLKNVGQTAILSVETVDMRSDGNNVLTLTSADVLDMSSTDVLTVMGDAGDKVSAAGFTRIANSGIYRQYTSAGATLLLEKDVIFVV